MHVFAGEYNPPGFNTTEGEQQTFWQTDYTKKYEELLKVYGHKIIMVNGGHIHTADVRASWFDDEDGQPMEPYYALLSSPSFSP